MAYSAGMTNRRITVAKRAREQESAFGGRSSVTQYSVLGEYWAAETYNKGVKALREGAYDAYDTLMFRLKFHEEIDRWCLIMLNGKWYQIQSFNASYHENQIQITAVEMANQQVEII